MSEFRPINGANGGGQSNGTRRPSDTSAANGTPSTAMNRLKVENDEDEDDDVNMHDLPGVVTGAGFAPNAFSPTPEHTSASSTAAAEKTIFPKALTKANIDSLRPARRRPKTENSSQPTQGESSVRNGKGSSRGRSRSLFGGFSRRRREVKFRGESYTTSNVYLTARQAGDGPVKRTYKNSLLSLLSNLDRYQEVKHRKEDLLQRIRTELTELPWSPDANVAVLKEAGFLGDRGISQFFSGPKKDCLPHDVIDDAFALYFRWNRGIFATDAMFGLKRMQNVNDDNTAKHGNWKLELNFKEKKLSADTEGDNSLTNGQWWPRQIAAWRDGAHGSQQSGISWKSPSGPAVSIVVSEGYEKDDDHGEQLWYCGTEQTNKDTPADPTAATKSMQKAYSLHTKIRVLRSAAKTPGNDNKWRPKKGIRYDGLYQIDRDEVLSISPHHMRFHLVRCARQSPLRNEGPATRPTHYELKMWQELTDNVKTYS